MESYDNPARPNQLKSTATTQNSPESDRIFRGRRREIMMLAMSMDDSWRQKYKPDPRLRKKDGRVKKGYPGYVPQESTPEEKEARLVAWRQRKYGLSEFAYRKMFMRQGECCAICKTPTPAHKSGWHVDHDHKTGKVRGILCSACNTGIGFLRDDKVILQAAVDYLTKHELKP